ncbi:DUF3006 domain-containing protein [Mobilitalea sibirica]|uniref:DUF3006 domain-containing protein n=1 Tax=Mobilitalea sibirica TaxID=1462919 RepID=A0A8J7HBW1_9FIRM|nr:DUF3006 domain-containing protein [Mobilitalea sibirica]MBH1940402.1 DUF3006 domain-containing protein [Mobilitalea sibirica]
MKKLIIDRFEDNYAICLDEDKTMIRIPKYKLPLGPKEGDTLLQDSDGMYRIHAETKTPNQNRKKGRMGRFFK